jgi:uncharacterized membrane protein (UPF0127 family)
VRALIPLLLAAAIAGACGDDAGPSMTAAPETRSPTVTPGQAASPTATPRTPTPSPGEGESVLRFQGAGGTALLTVETADSPDERATGLMNREEMAPDHGMIFVWPEDTGSRFWMQDTLIPLSIAFITAEGTIVHITDMEPLTTDLHASPEPYRFAVEVNQGWFAENGIEAGDVAEIPAEISPSNAS